MIDKALPDSQIKIKATKVKKLLVWYKGASTLLVSLVALLAVTYLIAFFYDQYSSFTVSVHKYDMVKQGLTLSETTVFENAVSKLDAESVKNITNISGLSLPENIDSINGQHSGTNYFAYTFYLQNSGEDAVSYKYSINLTNVTKGIDEAIRVRLYKNGQAMTFAKTKKDGSGPELDTDEFLTLNTVTEEYVRGFKPGDIDKYTVVIWLEGDDPECVDDIIGGRFKAGMVFEIVEAS